MPALIHCPLYFRFHFSKNLFARIKSKYHLAGYLRSGSSGVNAQLSHRLRQYFALPLLKPEDMRGEVERLEREVRDLVVKNCTRKVVKQFNAFHKYVVNYWMRLHGPANISVFGMQHKTNNITER